MFYTHKFAMLLNIKGSHLHILTSLDIEAWEFIKLNIINNPLFTSLSN